MHESTESMDQSRKLNRHISYWKDRSIIDDFEALFTNTLEANSEKYGVKLYSRPSPDQIGRVTIIAIRKAPNHDRR